jgi:hypothetical protein
MARSIRTRLDKGGDAWELRFYLGRDSVGRVRHKSRLFRGARRGTERPLARLVTSQEDIPSVVPDEQARPWDSQTTFNNAISGYRANGCDDLSTLKRLGTKACGDTKGAP